MASDFLIDDPSIPTSKYFSAYSLKEKLSSYYNSLNVQYFAQDMYDFEYVKKNRNDIRFDGETWGIQEFYHVPYYNVMLEFRQIKLAIYQIEKYKDRIK